MKLKLVAVFAALALSGAASAGVGPSQASVGLSGVSAIAVVALPSVMVSGIAKFVDMGFNAIVTSMSEGSRRTATAVVVVTAKTSAGGEITVVLPRDAVDAAGLKPGSELVAVKSGGGLFITGNGKPLAFASPNGEGPTKNRQL